MLLQYYDMLFPDDDEGKGKPSFKLLQMAHAWRKAQADKEAAGEVQPEQEEQEEAEAAPNGEEREGNENGAADANGEKIEIQDESDEE